jgi:enoyl-CoA hydratase
VKTLAVERRDAVLVVTLSRPDRLNAVSSAMVEELHDVLDGLIRDSDTRIVVLAGAGRGFCSGMDVKGGAVGDGTSAPGQVPQGRVQQIYGSLLRSAELIPRLREIPQPIVAALHGPVVGMGISLALAADLRVADPTVRFVAPFHRLGLSGGDIGLSWLLPRMVGPAKAAEIFYRDLTLDAAQVEGLGLLTEVTAEGKDLDGALALAAELLTKSPFGLRNTKELLNLSLDAPGLRAHQAVENRSQALAFMTEDLIEGMSAVVERREPTFNDR